MTQRSRDGERGHLMAGLLAAIAIMMIFSMVTYQAWDQVKRRDDEAEMIFRAQDLARAINRFRRDRGTGPMKLEELMEPGQRGNYYLRKLWKDPLVKDGKWGLLYMGPNGQILDPTALPGIDGPEDEDQDRNRRRPRRSLFGNDPQQQQDQPQPGQTPFGQGPGAGGIGGGISSAGNQETGGLPIAGVRTLSKDKPFRLYRGFADYAQWYFTYLDAEGGAQAGQTQPPPQGVPAIPGAGQRPPGWGTPGGSRQRPSGPGGGQQQPGPGGQTGGRR